MKATAYPAHATVLAAHSAIGGSLRKKIFSRDGYILSNCEVLGCPYPPGEEDRQQFLYRATAFIPLLSSDFIFLAGAVLPGSIAIAILTLRRLPD